MSRPSRVRALLPLALVAAAGCQDYNFNPVGQCLLQPGTERVRLSDISTADVLFVVDESGSMRGEQDKLAAGFDRFIQNLVETNTARGANKLQPIDFHIAVTTSSVFWNEDNTSTCRSGCGTASGLVCCTATNVPVTRPIKCSGPGASCPSGTCNTNCRLDADRGLKGEYYCCDATTGIAAAAAREPVACQREGAACGTLEHHYNFTSTCTPGVAVDEWRYPQGDFVSFGGNPRVLHFDKSLYPNPPNPAATNRQGFTSDELKSFFIENVKVGTCGSGQEQALQAARLAVTKALAGQQRDTFSMAPGKVQTWNSGSREATSAAEWPHPNSKLVVVFVGDEDDCSSPDDPSAGVVWDPDQANPDTCYFDTLETDPGLKKQFAVSTLVDAFSGLDRPLGAAFIFPAAQTTCSGESCTAGQCCASDCPGSIGVCTRNLTCGGQAPGFRLLEARNTLRARGAETVIGSICDPQFDVLLDEIAEIVKPPATMTLPTQPAEGAITFLRVAAQDGQTQRICRGPAPTQDCDEVTQICQPMTADRANELDYDWWFVANPETRDPITVSRVVYINHDTGNCEANPGETYSADYVGLNPPQGCTTDADCSAALGTQTPWTCYTPPATGRGTCICGAP